MTRTKQRKTMVLQIADDDIATAVCGNRRRCVLAQALDRQLSLAGRGYIKADASGVRYNCQGYRQWFALPQPAIDMLRNFDEVGEKQGTMAARATITPGTSFKLTFIRQSKIPPKACRERMDQINRRRNQIAAEERTQGIIRRKRKRYTGT
jgi:hypothetical protein